MRTPLRTTLASALAVVLFALAPAVAKAASVEEIVRLSKSGVSDDVILALIGRDKTIFTIAPDDLLALKSEGVSEPVVLAMLKSGREEGEEAVARQAAQAAAERAEVALLPNVVVFGHGPDRPNSGHYDHVFVPSRPSFGGFVQGDLYPVPLTDTFDALPARRSLCIAEMRTGPSRTAFTYVTECPSQMEQRRGRLAR
jgi:hypothetical protein